MWFLINFQSYFLFLTQLSIICFFVFYLNFSYTYQLKVKPCFLYINNLCIYQLYCIYGTISLTWLMILKMTLTRLIIPFVSLTIFTCFRLFIFIDKILIIFFQLFNIHLFIISQSINVFLINKIILLLKLIQLIYF